MNLLAAYTLHRLPRQSFNLYQKHAQRSISYLSRVSHQSKQIDALAQIKVGGNGVIDM